MASSVVPARPRTCRICGAEGLEGEAFCIGQGNLCRACAGVRKRAWSVAVQSEGGERHERRKEQMRIAQAKRKYGLTAAAARALYEERLCQICGSDRGNRRLNIDHDHRSNQIRGVLCNRCNRGIGCFLDDVVLLLAAVEYLTASRAAGSAA